MIKVKRLGHATLATPDIEAGIAYYNGLLGLNIVERSKDRVIFCTKQGLEAIELERGEPNQVKRLSLQIVPGSNLAEVASQLQKSGLRTQVRHGVSPGIAQAVTIEDPSGVPIDLFADYKFAKLDTSPSVFNLLKLQHVAQRVPDVQKVVKFYTEVLGFRVSDWRGDFFVFLRCNPDHHSLNFIIDEKPQVHHIAFEVVNWSEIHKVVDHLAQHNVHLVWGPGRHIIGHSVSTYHRNADLVRVEIFTEMDQIKDEDLGYFDPRPWHQEFPLYPKSHSAETLRNYWGFGSERVIPGYQTTEIPQYGEIRG